jgi:hypothetical protein
MESFKATALIHRKEKAVQIVFPFLARVLVTGLDKT